MKGPHRDGPPRKGQRDPSHCRATCRAEARGPHRCLGRASVGQAGEPKDAPCWLPSLLRHKGCPTAGMSVGPRHSAAAPCPHCHPNALGCWQPSSSGQQAPNPALGPQGRISYLSTRKRCSGDAQPVGQDLGLQLIPLSCPPCLPASLPNSCLTPQKGGSSPGRTGRAGLVGARAEGWIPRRAPAAPRRDGDRSRGAGARHPRPLRGVSEPPAGEQGT